MAAPYAKLNHAHLATLSIYIFLLDQGVYAAKVSETHLPSGRLAAEFKPSQERMGPG